MEQRTYLTVTREERQRAFSAAGKLRNGDNALSFDRSQKLWYAREGADLSHLQPWLPQNAPVGQFSRVTDNLSPAEELAATLESAGFKLDGHLPDMDGKRHRVPVEGDKAGAKSGVYQAWPDGRPAGWYENHRSSDGRVNWKSTGQISLDPVQSLQQRAQSAQKVWDRQREQQASYDKMGQQLTRQWKRMPAATDEHPYLQRKGVHAVEGVRQDKYDNLVIPLRNPDGHIRSVEYIHPDGTKQLKKDAEKSGNYFVVGGELSPDKPIQYAEGYATAASLHLATGLPVVMTVDAGNMVTVAKRLHEQFPQTPHLIYGEDDYTKADNKGLHKAQQAAEAVKGLYLVPQFTEEERQRAFAGESFSDFNDIHQARGLEAVRAQVAPVLDNLFPAWRLILEKNTMSDKPGSSPAPDQPVMTDAEVISQQKATPEPGQTVDTPQPAVDVPEPEQATTVIPPAPATPEPEQTVDTQQLTTDVPGSEQAAAVIPPEPATPEPEQTVDTQQLATDVHGPEQAAAVMPPEPAPPEYGQTVKPDNNGAVDVRQPDHDMSQDEEQVLDLASEYAGLDIASAPENSATAGAEQPAVNEPQPAPLPGEDIPSIASLLQPQPETAEESVPEPEIAPGTTRATTQAQENIPPDGLAFGPASATASGPGEQPAQQAAAPEPLDLDALIRGFNHEVDGHTVVYTLRGEKAFVDHGQHLTMATPEASKNDEMVLGALLISQRLKHGAVEITGSPEFEQRVLGLIVKHNLQVELRLPDQQARLDALRQAAALNTADGIKRETAPENGPVPAPGTTPQSAQATASEPEPAPPKPAPGVAPVTPAATEPTEKPVAAAEQPAAQEAPQPEDIRQGVTGTLVSHGPAPFNFDNKNTESYYATLRTRDGTKTYWGVELNDALNGNGLKKGDAITLRHLGKQPVTVNYPVKNDEGKIERWESKETHRNQWEARPALNRARLVADATQAAPPSALSPCDGNAFWALQNQLIQRTRLSLPATPDTGHNLLWLKPNGSGTPAPDTLPVNTPVPAATPQTGRPLMAARDEQGQPLLLLMQGQGDLVQGVMKHDGQYVHVLGRMSTPPNGTPYLTLNQVSPDGSLKPVARGNAVNAVRGAEVSFDKFVFRLAGEDKQKIVATLSQPQTMDKEVHARLGFTQAWTPPEPKEKPENAPKPKAQPAQSMRPGM